VRKIGEILGGQELVVREGRADSKHISMKSKEEKKGGKIKRGEGKRRT